MYSKEFRDQVLADVKDIGVLRAAKKHNISRRTVSLWRKQEGARPSRVSVLDSQKCELIGEYLKTHTLKETAAHFQVNVATIRNRIHGGSIEGTVKHNRARIVLDGLNVSEILTYASRYGIQGAARKYNLSNPTVRRFAVELQKSVEDNGLLETARIYNMDPLICDRSNWADTQHRNHPYYTEDFKIYACKYYSRFGLVTTSSDLQVGCSALLRWRKAYPLVDIADFDPKQVPTRYLNK